MGCCGWWERGGTSLGDNENTSANSRARARTNLWFLHNPPYPTRTHLSPRDLHELWPIQDASVVAGKKQAAIRRRLDTQVTIDDITITVPGEDAIITQDGSIVVTAPHLENPLKLFRKIVDYEKIRSIEPRVVTRTLITALPVASGVTYVILSKPDQSATIMIGGFLSIAGAIAYNSYHIGIYLRRTELTNYLERTLGGETCTQGKALDNTIMMIRRGYDEITRQLTIKALVAEGCDPQRAEILAATAMESGPRQAAILAPEHAKALQQTRPYQASSYFRQLFPEARHPKLEQLITIR
jgi:hypothetical protein